MSLILFLSSESWHSEYAKVLFLLIYFFFEFIILYNYRLDVSHLRFNQKIALISTIKTVKTINSVPALVNLENHRVPEVFLRWTYLNFQTRVAPKVLAWFSFFKISVWTFLQLEFSNKINIFHPCIGVLTDQNSQKMLIILTCLYVQTHFFSSACFILLWRRQSIYYYLRQRDRSFLNFMKVVL